MVNESGVTGYRRTIQSAGDGVSHQKSEISRGLEQSISKVQNVVTLLKRDSQQSQIDSQAEEGIFSKLWSWTNQKVYTAVQYVQETFVPTEAVEESFTDDQVDAGLLIQQDVCLDEEWVPEQSEVEEDGDWKDAVDSKEVEQETSSCSQEPTFVTKEESTSWSETIGSLFYSVLPRPATEEDEMRVDSSASVPDSIQDESECQGLLSKAFESGVESVQAILTTASNRATKVVGEAALKAVGYLGEFREEKKRLEADLLKLAGDETVVRSISEIVSSPLGRLVDAVSKDPKLFSALSSSTTLIQEDGALSTYGELMLSVLKDPEMQCLLTNQLLHVTTEVYKIVDQIQAEMVMKFATDCLKSATEASDKNITSGEYLDDAALNEEVVRKIKENVVGLLFPHGAQDIKLGAFSQIQEAQLLKEVVYERVEQGISLLVVQITTQLTSNKMRQELAIQGAKLAADTIEGMLADKEQVVANAKKLLQAPSVSVANTTDTQQVAEFTYRLKQMTRALIQVITSQKLAEKTGVLFDRFIDKIGPLLAERIKGISLVGIMNSQIILAATLIDDLPIDELLKAQAEKNKRVQEQSSKNISDEKHFEQNLEMHVDRFMHAFTKFLPQTKEIFQEVLEEKLLGSEQAASNGLNPKKTTHHIPKWAQRALLRTSNYVIKAGLILFQKIVGSKKVSKTVAKKITNKMTTAIKNLNVQAIASSSVHSSSTMIKQKAVVHVQGLN